MLGISPEEGQGMGQDRKQGRQILDSAAGAARQIHYQ
jgi:hypothetical protein